MKNGKVPVSPRSVMRRMNRLLAPRQEIIKKHRGDLYILIDEKKHTAGLIDLAKVARERGVLQPWETISDETLDDVLG